MQAQEAALPVRRKMNSSLQVKASTGRTAPEEEREQAQEREQAREWVREERRLPLQNVIMFSGMILSFTVLTYWIAVPKRV